MGKVSIIIPAYNAERYISNCIESLLDQTYDDIEIIIVNDGSEDSTKDIVDKYAAVDKRIIAVHLENGGVSTARNKGLEISSGSYVTFVDSDDWVEPDMLSFAVNKIEETKADIVIWSYFKNYIDKQLALSLLPGGSQVFTNNKDILFLRSIYQMYGEDRVRESVSAGAVWCKLYKKEILKENNLKFNKGLIRAQDTIFSLNAFLHASKIVYYDVNLYHYRITNTSTCSGTRFINNTEKPFNLLLDEFSNFISTNNNT
ncbi:glycosyltransferase family 2 protein, partial [Shouchella clausii]